MTKRETLALQYWYERQPATWRQRHTQWPNWLRTLFARYVAAELMGGGRSLFWPWLAFVVTCRIFSRVGRK